MEILTGHPDLGNTQSEKAASVPISSFQKVVDRSTYTGGERYDILRHRDSWNGDTLALVGKKPSNRIVSAYYPFLLPKKDSFEIRYGTDTPGYILFPDDSPSYIRSLLAVVRRGSFDPNEMEKILERLQTSYPEALKAGMVSVVNPITLEKTAITSMNVDLLPPSGIMVARGVSPVMKRVAVGYDATGSLFEEETYYDPARDQFNNVLSGLVIDRIT